MSNEQEKFITIYRADANHGGRIRRGIAKPETPPMLEIPPGVFRMVEVDISPFESEIQLIPTPAFPASGIGGEYDHKAKEMIRVFDIRKGNTTYVLSGIKGTGKSMLAGMVSHEAHKLGMPTLVADQINPAVLEFLRETRQEVVVLFDEFEKQWKTASSSSEQTFLKMLDGVDKSNKKLFILTQNVLEVPEYFTDRPGRVFNRITFGSVGAEEIKAIFDKRNYALTPEDWLALSYLPREGRNYDFLFNGIISSMEILKCTPADAVYNITGGFTKIDSTSSKVHMTLGDGFAKADVGRRLAGSEFSLDFRKEDSSVVKFEFELDGESDNTIIEHDLRISDMEMLVTEEFTGLVSDHTFLLNGKEVQVRISVQIDSLKFHTDHSFTESQRRRVDFTRFNKNGFVVKKAVQSSKKKKTSGWSEE